MGSSITHTSDFALNFIVTEKQQQFAVHQSLRCFKENFLGRFFGYIRDLLWFTRISDKKTWSYSAQSSLLWNEKLNEKIHFHAHTAKDLIPFHTQSYLHAINSIFHHNDGEKPIDFHQHHHVHVPVEHARNGFKNLRSNRRVTASLLREKWEENVNECNDSFSFPERKFSSSTWTLAVKPFTLPKITEGDTIMTE